MDPAVKEILRDVKVICDIGNAKKMDVEQMGDAVKLVCTFSRPKMLEFDGIDVKINDQEITVPIVEEFRPEKKIISGKKIAFVIRPNGVVEVSTED